MNRTKTIFLALTTALFALPTSLWAKPHHHHKSTEAVKTVKAEPVDLSPIIIQPYVLPTDPKQATFLRKMNLENGLMVHGTHWIPKSNVASRDLFVLEVTQSLEGGFDSVNLYDKGIISWGIMQWTARTGSMVESLKYVKRQLWTSGRKSIWDRTFVANGLDVDSHNLIAYGKPLLTPMDTRLAFRGTAKVGNYDPKLATHWVTTFARAGRQPAIAQLQVEYASHLVDAILQKRLNNLPYHAPGRSGLTTEDLTANDPYAQALIFSLWTNNPRNAFSYISEAARAARSVSNSDDPSLWTPGAFSDALLRRCSISKFGNWRVRAAAIEARADQAHTLSPNLLTPFEQDYQMVLAQRKVRRSFELASRHAAETARKKMAAAKKQQQGVKTAKRLMPTPAVIKGDETPMPALLPNHATVPVAPTQSHLTVPTMHVGQ